MNEKAIRVLALIEAATVTGPAKNLIQVCRRSRVNEPGLPALEISIATFYRGRQSGNYANRFIEAVRESGTAIDIIPERYRFDIGALSHLRKMVDARRPDVIQTHGVKSHFLVRATGLGKRYPWIAFHHGYTAEDLKMRAYNQLNRWSLRTADRVITVCRPFAESLAAAGVPRHLIGILPNSIENTASPAGDEEEAKLRQSLKLLPGERMILTVGRFSREKAQVDLVKAVAELARDHPGLPFRLVMVGDGPERRAVESAAEALGLLPRTVFAGHRQDVRPYYRLADVFALPSLSEGSPNVILEAMAAGLPIVATAVGGVPETVQHEFSALLIPPCNSSRMAAEIARVLTDPVLADRLKSNAFDQINQYSPEAYMRSLAGHYEKVLERHSIHRRS